MGVIAPGCSTPDGTRPPIGVPPGASVTLVSPTVRVVVAVGASMTVVTIPG